MRLKSVLFAVIVSMTLGACSLFQSSCLKYVSDKQVFRASVEVTSTSVQLAQERAIANARRNIMEEVDVYIAEQFSYRSFLSDDNYEKKIDLMRTKVLEQCETACSRVSLKSGKIHYSTTLQISRSTVDEIISSCK